MEEVFCPNCQWQGDWEDCITHEHGGYEEYWGTRVRRYMYDYFCPECGAEVEDALHPPMVIPCPA